MPCVYLEKNIKMKKKEILVDQLLDYFLKEDTRFLNKKIPKNYKEKRTFLRGIINLRPPKELKEEILRLEDQLLKLELKEKKIMEVSKIPLIEKNICLWQGDITTLKIGAIVNAGNSQLLGCFLPNHSCIDNAIHTVRKYLKMHPNSFDQIVFNVFTREDKEIYERCFKIKKNN